MKERGWLLSFGTGYLLTGLFFMAWPFVGTFSQLYKVDYDQGCLSIIIGAVASFMATYYYIEASKQ